jgi:hypothetical protein
VIIPQTIVTPANSPESFILTRQPGAIPDGADFEAFLAWILELSPWTLIQGQHDGP